MLREIPPPKDIEGFWQLFLLWSSNFERARAAEVDTIHDAVGRLVDGARSLDQRIDDLEKSRDQRLELPLIVEQHEREIQLIKQSYLKIAAFSAGVSATILSITGLLGLISGFIKVAHP